MNDAINGTLCKVRAIRRARVRRASSHVEGQRRAIDAAVFTAELTALCARECSTPRDVLTLRALRVVRDPALYAAIERAVLRASCHCASNLQDLSDPVTRTLALCAWAFVSAGDSALDAVLAVLREGGDSEGAGAIVGGWLGVLHGCTHSGAPRAA